MTLPELCLSALVIALVPISVLSADAPTNAMMMMSPMQKRLVAIMPAMNGVCEMEEAMTFKLPMAKNMMDCQKCKRQCRDSSQCMMRCNAMMTPEVQMMCDKAFMDPMCRPVIMCMNTTCNATGDWSSMSMDRDKMMNVYNMRQMCMDKNCMPQMQACSKMAGMSDVCSLKGCSTSCRSDCRNKCATQCAA